MLQETEVKGKFRQYKCGNECKEVSRLKKLEENRFHHMKIKFQFSNPALATYSRLIHLNCSKPRDIQIESVTVLSTKHISMSKDWDYLRAIGIVQCMDKRSAWVCSSSRGFLSDKLLQFRLYSKATLAFER